MKSLSIVTVTASDPCEPVHLRSKVQEENYEMVYSLLGLNFKLQLLL